MFVNQLIHGGIRAILAANPSVFDDFILPDDLSGAEALVIDRILFKYGDTPLFCPDPNVMKYYIGNWCIRRSPLWLRFYQAEFTEYNPIENYNRSELTDDNFTHGHTVTTDDDLTHGHTVTTDDDLTNGLVVEGQISADNANTYQSDRKSTNSGTDERDITEEHTGTDERDITEEHTGTDYRHIDSKISGNIGVTTSQQMLESELVLIPKLDCIEFIADDFRAEFCLDMYN